VNHLAETAAAGADAPHEKKSANTSVVTFTAVGAGGFLADGEEFLLSDDITNLLRLLGMLE